MSEISKSKNSIIKDTIKIMKLVHNMLPSYIPLITLQTLIAAILPFINILYGSKIIDGIVTKKSKNALISYVMIMVISNLILGLIHFALDKKRLVNEQYIEKINKAKLGEKSLSIDYEILEKKETLELLQKAADGSNSSGGLTNLCSNVVELLQQIFSIIYALLLSIGLFTSISSNKNGNLFRFMNSPISSVVLFIFLIIAILFSTIISKQYSKMKYNFYINNVDSNRKFGYFFDFMYNYSIGKDIRIFQMDKFLDKKMLNIFGELKKSYTKLFKSSIKFEYYIIVLNKVWEYAAYLFVGIKAALGIITIGKLTLYVGVLKLLNASITELFSKYINLGVMCTYIKNYTTFLDIKNEKYEGTLPVEKRLDNEYELEFKNVSFHYPNSEEMILKNISMKLKVGNKMAIVGRNGAGKTTFIKLLCRLYDPTEGEILLNGINIKKYDYNEYLKIFSVVFQDFKLFSFSVAENVATSEEYDEAAIWKCLEQAGIKSRIEKLPEGITTSIFNNQEKGIEISGGEAQKLAIARALYKDAPVVILDEPTSALDPISEFEIYEKFNELVQEKTSIFISHRMSSCRMCNNILVFDKGQIVQIGNHEKLVNDKEGVYYSLWEAQAKYYI
ncbi:ABC transporter ATP-binding protein [Clostridium sp. 19966]|uniref:ABC transporter ATP-binding protein n=1 Tax=Clostridium sp. 19966 TaxID=2768166 RepID=UPI0028DF8537|nr:ABC transporter ATP-binding protein [Clostridium sp. 19966]MDT8715356.1 ABC transporter ATP-binding protein [Clostridium sp. 19966]